MSGLVLMICQRKEHGDGYHLLEDGTEIMLQKILVCGIVPHQQGQSPTIVQCCIFRVLMPTPDLVLHLIIFSVKNNTDDIHI